MNHTICHEDSEKLLDDSERKIVDKAIKHNHNVEHPNRNSVESLEEIAVDAEIKNDVLLKLPNGITLHNHQKDEILRALFSNDRQALSKESLNDNFSKLSINDQPASSKTPNESEETCVDSSTLPKEDQVDQPCSSHAAAAQSFAAGTSSLGSNLVCKVDDEISVVAYENELQMPAIMQLITRDLSEPYSIYTYRYFIHNWPYLCFLAKHSSDGYIGAIVCKVDMHRRTNRRGYIAMLAVDEKFRRRKVGSSLVRCAIDRMLADQCEEIVLETEVTNKPSLKLYENLGFVRDKRLFRYYLNGVDAFRLKLWLNLPNPFYPTYM